MTASVAGRPESDRMVAAPQSARSVPARLLVGAWGIFLGLLPLPLASNRPLFWCINTVIAGCFVAAVAMLRPAPLRFDGLIRAGFALCAALATVLLVWMLVQALLPLAPGSPLADPIWAAAAEALGEPLTARISAAPWQTLLAALRFATAVAVFWVTLRLSLHPGGAAAILRWLMWASVAYALYGLVLELVGSSTILWFEKWAYRDSLTATFVNRNAAAAYFGIGLLAALAEVISTARRRSAVSLGYLLLLLVPLAILANAIVLTGSRSGAAATALAAGVGLLLLVSVRRAPVLIVPLLAIVLVGLALATLHVSGAHLMARIEADGGSGQSRLWLYRTVAEMIAARPLTGIGAGTFQLVFPAWREPGQEMFLVWAQAHNVYLELAVELGLPAAAAMMLLVMLLMLMAARSLRRSEDGWHIALFALTSWLLLAAQGLVDFALQYQAITLTAAAALAMGIACAARPAIGTTQKGQML
jgi:Lipid A core - O-antigen ligase and related enzymes